MISEPQCLSGQLRQDSERRSVTAAFGYSHSRRCNRILLGCVGLQRPGFCYSEPHKSSTEVSVQQHFRIRAQQHFMVPSSRQHMAWSPAAQDLRSHRYDNSSCLCRSKRASYCATRASSSCTCTLVLASHSLPRCSAPALKPNTVVKGSAGYSKPSLAFQDSGFQGFRSFCSSAAVI